jgi:hypothetical protein
LILYALMNLTISAPSVNSLISMLFRTLHILAITKCSRPGVCAPPVYCIPTNPIIRVKWTQFTPHPLPFTSTLI